jgi:adenylate kinase
LKRRATGLAGLLWAGAVVSAQTPPKDIVLILLGAPGAGKTTQAKQLSRRFKIPSISASEMLKKAHGKKSPISRAVAVPTASGDLLNEEGLNQLLQYRVEKRDALHGFILDGYPTSARQAEFLAKLLEERKLPAPIVIHLQAPDAVVTARMRSRGRVDDKPAVIERRLADYRREEQFILDYYRSGRVIRVDATRPEKDVLAAILAQLGG